MIKRLKPPKSRFKVGDMITYKQKENYQAIWLILKKELNDLNRWVYSAMVLSHPRTDLNMIGIISESHEIPREVILFKGKR
jgi:hypothetical protein